MMKRPELSPIYSAPPDPTRVKSVRTGPGGARPKVMDFTLWSLKPGDPDRRPRPAWHVPTGGRAGKCLIRRVNPVRRRRKPDLSEEETPKALPTDGKAGHWS